MQCMDTHCIYNPVDQFAIPPTTRRDIIQHIHLLKEEEVRSPDVLQTEGEQVQDALDKLEAIVK